MSLPNLQILNAKSRQFGSPQSAAYEHGKHCEIADTAKIVPVGFLQQHSGLILGQPVSYTGAKLLCAFDWRMKLQIPACSVRNWLQAFAESKAQSNLAPV